MNAVGVAAAVLAGIAALAGCTSESDRTVSPAASVAPPGASLPAPSSESLDPLGVIVEGRASEPAQVDAPGIQFTKGVLNVQVGTFSGEITARDWNTIIDSSVVPHPIGLTLSSDFKAAETTRNRMQYLADIIALHAPTDFTPVGLVAVPDGDKLVVIAALSNLTSNTYYLQGLRVRVDTGSPLTRQGSGTFYLGSNGLVIPGDGIYFVRLELPLVDSDSNSHDKKFSFQWRSLQSCGGSPCAR